MQPTQLSGENVVYIQGYMNEKALFSKTGKHGHTIEVSPSQLVAPVKDGVLEWYTKMYGVYDDASSDTAYINSARIEARVPISQAHESMLNLECPEEYVSQIPPAAYWYVLLIFV